MLTITNVYTSNIGDYEQLRYARVRDAETGEEHLLEPYELLDPSSTEVGDEYAYKVSLVADRLFNKYQTEQDFS